MHVYAITNTVNGKIYVGQHGKDDLAAYLRLHNVNPALKGKDKKTLLFRAIRKYGAAAFTISSLVQPVDGVQMDALEQFFIRTLESQNPEIGYNITAGGGGVRNFHWSEEQRKHISEMQIGRIPWNKGRKCPEISAYMKGNTNGKGGKGKVVSLKQRERIRETMIAKGIVPSIEARRKGGRVRQGGV